MGCDTLAILADAVRILANGAAILGDAPPIFGDAGRRARSGTWERRGPLPFPGQRTFSSAL